MTIRSGVHELREDAERRGCIRRTAEVALVVFLVGMAFVAKLIVERAQAEYEVRNERVIAE